MINCARWGTIVVHVHSIERVLRLEAEQLTLCLRAPLYVSICPLHLPHVCVAEQVMATERPLLLNRAAAEAGVAFVEARIAAPCDRCFMEQLHLFCEAVVCLLPLLNLPLLSLDAE